MTRQQEPVDAGGDFILQLELSLYGVHVLESFSAVSGAWRYSMMVGVIPCSPNSSRVWRDLLTCPYKLYHFLS